MAENDFTLTCSGAIPGQLGIFYFGDNTTQVPFGQGLRCVAGSTVRFAPQQVDPQGMSAQPVDFTGAVAQQGPLVPGSTWYFQFWYRDPAGGGAGFNLSDGLSATFL